VREPNRLDGRAVSLLDAAARRGEAVVGQDQALFDELDATQVECGNQSVREWEGIGVYLHIRPTRIFTFIRQPREGNS
jgi:hypothetical protein